MYALYIFFHFTTDVATFKRISFTPLPKGRLVQEDYFFFFLIDRDSNIALKLHQSLSETRSIDTLIKDIDKNRSRLI